MRKVDGDRAARAQRVLELNPDSAPFAALQKAVEAGDKDTVSKYAKLLYGQALLLADLPLEDPAEYAQLVCSLMVGAILLSVMLPLMNIMSAIG